MPNDLLWAEAALGRDAQEFVESDIGRYMLGRCEEELHDAQAALARVSPWRRQRILQLQSDIRRAQSFVGWLAELIEAGKQAEAALEADD